MNNNKTNLLVVCCFMICGGIGISTLIKDNNKLYIVKKTGEE